jgi:hypothetical protein
MIISNTITRKYVLLFILQMWYSIPSQLLIPDDYGATTTTIMPAIEQAAIVLKQHMILFVSMWPYAQLGHQNISFRSSISVMVLKYVKVLNYKIRTTVVRLFYFLSLLNQRAWRDSCLLRLAGLVFRYRY